MTMPLMRPKRKNPVLRTRLPTLPPGQRGRVALGMTAAAAEGRFELQVCDDCGAVQYPPREACHRCLSPHLKWREQSGEGELLFGRVTYQMMESAWRRPDDGAWPGWMQPWQVPFAETIDRARKHVVSSTLDDANWNADLVRGDLADEVRRLKQEPGEGLFLGGVTLPAALADQGLVDEYAFLVQPLVAGHGPRLLDGLRAHVQLELVDRQQLGSGALAVRYRPVGG